MASAAQTIRVTFEVTAETRWGDTVVLAGSIWNNWAPDSGIALQTDEASYPVWTTSVNLDASVAELEYKVVILRAGGDPEWEPREHNRRLILKDVAEVKVTTSYGSPTAKETLSQRRQRSPIASGTGLARSADSWVGGRSTGAASLPPTIMRLPPGGLPPAAPPVPPAAPSTGAAAAGASPNLATLARLAIDDDARSDSSGSASDRVPSYPSFDHERVQPRSHPLGPKVGDPLAPIVSMDMSWPPSLSPSVEELAAIDETAAN